MVPQGIKIAKEGLANPFFSQVFKSVPQNIEMPTVKNYYSSAGLLGDGDAVLKLENGDPFLLKFNIGRGTVYLFTAALEPSAGNFYQSVLFFPTVSNCAINNNKVSALFGYSASAKGIALRSNYSTADGGIILKHQNTEFVPEIQYTSQGQELYIGNEIRDAGFYYLSQKLFNILKIQLFKIDNFQ